MVTDKKVPKKDAITAASPVTPVEPVVQAPIVPLKVENPVVPAASPVVTAPKIDADEDIEADPELDVPLDDLRPEAIGLRESLKPFEKATKENGALKYPAIAGYKNRDIQWFAAKGYTAEAIRAKLDAKAIRPAFAMSNFSSDDLVARIDEQIAKIKKSIDENEPIALRERVSLDVSEKELVPLSPEELAALPEKIRVREARAQQNLLEKREIVTKLEKDIQQSLRGVHALQNELKKSRIPMEDFLDAVCITLKKTPVDQVLESRMFGFKWPALTYKKILSDDALKALLLPAIKRDAAILPLNPAIVKAP